MTTDQKNLERIEVFIRAHQLAVLSTVDRNCKPESAVVGFAQTENFEIVIGTFNTSRKYVNLQTNANVSLVIGWENGKTAQIEGIAQEITSQAEIDHALRVILAKTSSAAKFVSRSEERLFRIEPKWIRYSDVSVDPWETFEIKF